MHRNLTPDERDAQLDTLDGCGLDKRDTYTSPAQLRALLAHGDGRPEPDKDESEYERWLTTQG